MREIIFDTETTGFDPQAGDRVVEIGCVEVFDLLPTGRSLHLYINPERDMPAEAFAIHGLSEEFLRGHPVFSELVTDFIDFIGDDARLVAHNAEFDVKFLNFELARCGFKPLDPGRIVDTLAIARQKFPGSPSSLDALCKRFGIDNSARTKHGALLDSELLAEVYLELRGGRQVGLELGALQVEKTVVKTVRQYREPRPHAPTAAELAAHTAFVDKLKDAIWRQD